ncbi:peptidyl-prolyl cis-trans isomerase [Candidatus Woesearchaeota archaeon]|nr:peptidyl-prolyl cis-trans isomerase [Candidatus Woesearchaeota archaeon]
MRAILLTIVIAILAASCSNKDVKMNPQVILETTKGTIEIELYPQQAPVTVTNFLAYVNEGHYDGTVFHRVIPGFMIQGGGFTPDGTQKPTRGPIKLESNNGIKNNIGTIAMARTSVPDSATSQFFINVANNDFLNSAPGNDGYAVFGKVVSGMEVVNAIAAVETGNRGGNSDWPVEDVAITKAYVKK